MARDPGDELMPCPRCGNMVKLKFVEPGKHMKGVDEGGRMIPCN
jgi:hypothetical protein